MIKIQPPSRRAAVCLEAILVVLAALAFTAWLTYPLAFRAATHAIEPGDSLLNAYIQAWTTHTLRTGPLHLFDANMYYPAKHTLALSENLLGNQILFAPVYAATDNPLLASNVVILVSFMLCGACMYLLLRYLTRSPWAAAVGSFIYAFAPARTSQMGHMQLLSFYWAPLTVLFLFRFVRTKRWPSLIALSLTILLQILCSLYLGYLVILIVSFFFLAFAIRQPELLERRMFARLAVAAVLVGVAVFPITRPYRSLQSAGILKAEYVRENTIAASASPVASYLDAAYGPHFLYGHLLDRFHSRELDWEKNLFPGFLAAALALIAVACELAKRYPKLGAVQPAQDMRAGDAKAAGAQNCLGALLPPGIVLGAVLTVVVAYVLSLGPYLRLHDQVTRVRMPFYWLQKWVPGMGVFRVPARFGLMVMFGLAVLAGIGFRYAMRAGERWRILRHRFAKAAATIMVIALLSAEYNFTPMPLYAAMVPANLAPEYRWLAEQPRNSVTLELPIPTEPPDPYPLAAYVYASAYHWQPLVDGYSGYAPQTWGEMVKLANALPSPDAVQALGSLGVRYVLVHTGRLGVAELKPWRDLPDNSGLVAVRTFGTAEIYEIRTQVCSNGLGSLAYSWRAPDLAPVRSSFPFVLSVRTGERCWANARTGGIEPLTAEWRSEGSGIAKQVQVMARWPLYLRELSRSDFPQSIPAPNNEGTYVLRILTPTGAALQLPSLRVTLRKRIFVDSSNSPFALSARYELRQLAAFRAGAAGPIEFYAQNTGGAVWLTGVPRGSIGLGYRWLNGRGQEVKAGRLYLPYPVYPGSGYNFRGEVEAPSEPGNYVLSLELVSELVTWFHQQGVPRVEVLVHVDR